MRTCVIFNPAAKGQKAERLRARLDTITQNAVLKKTTAPNDARRLAAEAIAEGCDTVIAAGGDGTINEVLNGIGDAAAFDRVRLGVLPLGTVNVFAKELKIPSHPGQAWELILRGRYTRIDLGWAEFSDHTNSTPSPRPSGERPLIPAFSPGGGEGGRRPDEGEASRQHSPPPSFLQGKIENKNLLTPALSSVGGGEGEKNEAQNFSTGRLQRRYFMQLAGAGLDARAIELVDWQQKKKVGPLAYVIAGLKAVRERQPQITVTAGGKTLTGELALIGNGGLYGGKFDFFPGSNMRDGLLDVAVFPRVSWWRMLRCAGPLLTLGRLPESLVQRLRAESFTVSVEAARGDAHPTTAAFEVDGEWAGKLPATFGVEREKLRVIVP